MTFDIVVDTLFEENLKGALQTIGVGRLIMDKDDPEEPYLTPGDGYLVIRLRDRDPYMFVRELERRTSSMRIVKIVDRTAADQRQSETQSAVPGSARAHRTNGLL